jgi:hypothetical protein
VFMGDTIIVKVGLIKLFFSGRPPLL